MGIRDQILSADDRQSKGVTVKEWGDAKLFVRTMTGTERDAFEASILNSEGKVSGEGLRAKLLVRCLTDETGARIFTDDDATALGEKSAKVMDRLFSFAQKQNGIGKDDVDELTKNS